MLTAAISKIKDEMAGNKANSYIQIVGGFILNHLEICPKSAEKIVNTDKTIAKLLGKMNEQL